MEDNFKNSEEQRGFTVAYEILEHPVENLEEVLKWKI